MKRAKFCERYREGRKHTVTRYGQNNEMREGHKEIIHKGKGTYEIITAKRRKKERKTDMKARRRINTFFLPTCKYVFRCSDGPMFGCSDVRTIRCSDVRMFRCSDVPTFGCSDVRMFRCSDVPMFGCSDVTMFRCSDVPMFRYSDVRMFRCSDVRMFRCSDVPMFRCSEGLKLTFTSTSGSLHWLCRVREERG